MRVLFITPRFPGRHLRGDQMRAFTQIRHLATRHAVTLLCAAAPEPGLEGAEELRVCCERILVLPQSRWRAVRDAICALPGGRPLQTAIYDAWPPRDALDALLADGAFDLAHVQMARLAGVAGRLRGLPCVLDLVDALSLNMRRRAELDRGPLRPLARIEADRLARLERSLCREVAAVAISSRQDGASIDGGRELQWVPNGVELERFPFRPLADRGQVIVFGANLGYFPNVDAAQWFATEVLPLVRRACPAAELHLVGRRPAAALERLARRVPGVRLIGPVPDMHAELAGAAVAISPLRAGSGQQLKLMEAMASGAPLVASARSAAGLDARPGEHLLVANDADGLARAVIRLLQDRAFAAELARRARSWVEVNACWSLAAERLDRIWRDAAAAGARSARS